MSNVNRLRDEARKRRAAVTNKIARTKRESGANLAGSEFDPRRDHNIIKRYNASQLNAYLNQLNDFMRRGNQFVGGNGGAPLKRGTFIAYKRNEAEQNAANAAHAASVGDIVTPLGMTVRQSKAMLPETQGSAVYGPYRKFDRMSNEITSQSALEKLNRDMVRRLSSGYLQGKIESGRENLKKALTIIGDDRFHDQIDELTEYQFDALWYGTTIAESVFMQYGIEKDRAAGSRKERWQDKVVESAADELGSVLEWASKLPENRPRG